MMPINSELAGRALRRHVDVADEPGRHAADRARLVTAAGARAPRKRTFLLAAAALVPALVAACVVVWFWQLEPRVEPLSFTVGADVHRGKVGVYYTAPAETTLPLTFSDGSAVTVQPRSGVRVGRTDAKTTTVLLETGKAQFLVTHRPGSSWQVGAGPYTVIVTGTSFDLSWDAAIGTFELVMRDGTVIVQGPGLETGVIVKDRQRFVSRVSSDMQIATVADANADEPAPPSSASPGAAPPSEPAPAASLQPRLKSEAEAWSKLVARGDYGRIVQQAERRGLENTLQGAASDDLLALADAARFTARADLARRALLALRSRFGGTERATAAAFVLGRMLDDGGDQRSAITWYERYLAEGGPLAPEALGRRMLALRRLGDVEASRKAAREYVQRFPNGTYAAQARELDRR